MRLLHIITSVDPKAGGVAEGVLQSGQACVRLGHQVEVASLDTSDAAFLSGYPLKVYPLGPAKTSFAYSAQLAPWLRNNSHRYDAIIVNGLWQYPGIGTRNALRHSPVPYFVFTHGMLDPWFRKTYPLKHLKKWLFWPWGDYRVLRDARAVLFTCEEERLLARQSFWLYKADERVVAFGTQTPPDDTSGDKAEELFSRYPHLRGKRLLLFIGRLHEKKGCDILIEAFAKVAFTDPRLHLVMAGPDSSGWQTKLEALVATLNLQGRVTFTGMLEGNAKWCAFHASEAHVLPSHQENFGIAVVESLGCGSPVLISDKVNIWREIEADGAGFVASDTVEGTLANLTRWLELSAQERGAMRALAKASFNKRFTVEAMAESLLDAVRREAQAGGREAVLSTTSKHS